VPQDDQQPGPLIPEVLEHRLVEEPLARAHLGRGAIPERTRALELLDVRGGQDPELGEPRRGAHAAVVDQRICRADEIGHDVAATAVASTLTVRMRYIRGNQSRSVGRTSHTARASTTRASPKAG